MRRASLPKWNYLLEGRPLQYRLPLLGECSQNPSVSVHQLALLWETAFGFSEFILKTFSAFAHFMVGDLRVHLATATLKDQQFLTKKQHDPFALPSLLTRSCPKQLFLFVSPDEKSPQRETFYWCGIGETKNSGSTKRYQNKRVQRPFWALGKNTSIGVLHQMENTLKVTEV